MLMYWGILLRRNVDGTTALQVLNNMHIRRTRVCGEGGWAAFIFINIFFVLISRSLSLSVMSLRLGSPVLILLCFLLLPPVPCGSSFLVALFLLLSFFQLFSFVCVSRKSCLPLLVVSFTVSLKLSSITRCVFRNPILFHLDSFREIALHLLV